MQQSVETGRGAALGRHRKFTERPLCATSGRSGRCAIIWLTISRSKAGSLPPQSLRIEPLRYAARGLPPPLQLHGISIALDLRGGGHQYQLVRVGELQATPGTMSVRSPTRDSKISSPRRGLEVAETKKALSQHGRTYLHRRRWVDILSFEINVLS